uniref:Secreted protein n=1 Tax=Haemonchus placei TaxID=6290 RepID=A0A0N4WL97_HAEPC
LFDPTLLNLRNSMASIPCRRKLTVLGRALISCVDATESITSSTTSGLTSGLRRVFVSDLNFFSYLVQNELAPIRHGHFPLFFMKSSSFSSHTSNSSRRSL